MLFHESPPVAPIAYRVTDVARMLRLSRSSAYRLVQSKELRAVKIRGSVRVLKRDFDNYLEAQSNG